MTNREALLSVAETMRGKAELDWEDDICFGFGNWGICDLIFNLAHDNKITKQQCEEIRALLPAQIPDGQKWSGFCWPLTEKGRLARIEWCERMADAN